MKTITYRPISVEIVNPDSKRNKMEIIEKSKNNEDSVCLLESSHGWLQTHTHTHTHTSYLVDSHNWFPNPRLLFIGFIYIKPILKPKPKYRYYN